MAEGLASSLREARERPVAFVGFYEAQARELLVFFTRRTYDVEIARDLTAETFAQAFEHRRHFRGSTDPEAVGWLYGIARHQLGRYARRGVVHHKAISRLGIEVPAVSDEDAERIVELAGLSQIRAEVAAAFSGLPRSQSEALRLRVIDERPYPDVAAILGISEQTARARVSRALKRLAGSLEKSTKLPTEVAP